MSPAPTASRRSRPLPLEDARTWTFRHIRRGYQTVDPTAEATMPIAAMPMDKTEQMLAKLRQRSDLERLSRRARDEAPHKLRGVLPRERKHRRREGLDLPPPIDPLEDAGA